MRAIPPDVMRGHIRIVGGGEKVCEGRHLKKGPSWEMGKDYTQQFVVSLRGFPCL
ncbi:hypothetical protein TUM20903_23580 [Citrobacter koseri]|nr:hypothetical protein TUM13189_23750 [Citrobacter koseri]BDG89620.1 hypothetical protein TUM20903_23580 [Citrobacter koseri]